MLHCKQSRILVLEHDVALQSRILVLEHGAGLQSRILVLENDVALQTVTNFRRTRIVTKKRLSVRPHYNCEAPSGRILVKFGSGDVYD